MPGFNELKILLTQEAKKRKLVKAVEQAPTPVDYEEVTKARLLTDHPGWLWYLDLVNEQRTQLMTQKAAILKEFEDTPDIGSGLIALKLDLVRVGAEIRAMNQLLRFVTNKVVQGVDKPAQPVV